MKSLFLAAASISLALGFASCDSHSWESTSSLFSHGDGHGGHGDDHGDGHDDHGGDKAHAEDHGDKAEKAH